ARVPARRISARRRSWGRPLEAALRHVGDGRTDDRGRVEKAKMSRILDQLKAPALKRPRNPLRARRWRDLVLCACNDQDPTGIALRVLDQPAKSEGPCRLTVTIGSNARGTPGSQRPCLGRCPV